MGHTNGLRVMICVAQVPSMTCKKTSPFTNFLWSLQILTGCQKIYEPYQNSPIRMDQNGFQSPLTNRIHHMHQNSPRQSDPNTRLRAGLACWVPVAMAQVTHYIPQQFVVQKYLSNTQIHPVCWLYMILHDCIILYEYPSNGATFFRLQIATTLELGRIPRLGNVGHPHPWHSVSSTELAVVPHGATRES